MTPDLLSLPKRFDGPLSAGPAAGHAVPFALLRENYYKAMGWDPTTGEPLPQTQVELKIPQIDLG